MPKRDGYKDITGQVFGKLTVLGFGDRQPKVKGSEIRWKCRCECGNETLAFVSNLKGGKTKSCGCGRQNGGIKSPRYKHGKSRTSEYNIWCKMKSRCEDPSDPAYKYYGGRGIAVDPFWRVSFESFLNDMGAKPSPKHTLDRIDNNGPYSKENCRWATYLEQANNRRSNVKICFEGRVFTYAELERYLGAPTESAKRFIGRHGYSVDEYIQKLKNTNELSAL